MFNTKSDYALNKKDSEAIVYRDATGMLFRLTRSDFASEAEFLRWKAWSDEDYHAAEKEGHIHSNHTLSLHGLSEEAAAVPSAEMALADLWDEQTREYLRRLLMEGMDVCLSPAQRRRLWLCCVEGLTVRQAALIEQTSFQNIAQSVTAARKKIEKYIAEHVDKTLF